MERTGYDSCGVESPPGLPLAEWGTPAEAAQLAMKRCVGWVARAHAAMHPGRPRIRGSSLKTGWWSVRRSGVCRVRRWMS
eukprot:4679387-Prymnesium_polylepis.1